MANSVKTPTQSLEKVLNHQVANFGVLYIKLHNFHWYVRGSNFFTLHIKFEELYTETTLHFDAIAERLLTLKGQPVATMQGMLKESDIKEAQGTEKDMDMVRTLVKDFDLINKQLREGMEIAEEAGDQTTADLLLSIHASLEKHAWMLETFLG
jgi:starvation-inducible DNA-binding protein